MTIKQALTRGFKYTVACFHPKYGYVEAFHIKLVCVSVKLIHAMDKIPSTMIVNEGPPSLFKFIILKHKAQYVIWKGHHAVNTGRVVSRSLIDVDGVQVMEEKCWSPYDGRYLLRAKRSVKIDPVIENIDPLKPEVLLTYQCISERQHGA